MMLAAPTSNAIAPSPAIMERGSEKPRRGRPVKIDTSHLTSLFPDLRTARGLANRSYAMRAMNILKAHPSWFCDWSVAQAGGPGFKFSLLTELGRLDDADSIVAMADQISRMEPRPTVSQAVAIARQARVGATEASAIDLTWQIVAVINRYIRTHPNCTVVQVLASLQNAADEWSEDASE